MRLVTFFQVEIRCGLSVMLVVPLMLMLDASDALLLAIFSLTLHEASHSLVARAFGYEIEAIELQPFGFVARLKTGFHSVCSEFMVALAGPLASGLLGVCSAAAVYYFPNLKNGLSAFMRVNLVLALVNLFPALPLDGGRMLRCLLSMLLSPRLSTLVTAWLGILFGAGFCALGVLSWPVSQNVTILLMGGFLALAAARELKELDTARLGAMMRRSRALAHGESLRLSQIVLHQHTSGSGALKQLSAGRYNVIYVADGSMRILGRLDEQALLEGIARLGASASLGELLRASPSFSGRTSIPV